MRFSIWNLRARFLLHTATWKFAVTPFPVGAHMEYPAAAVERGGARMDVCGFALARYRPSPPRSSSAVGLVLRYLVSTLALARGASAGLLAGSGSAGQPGLHDSGPAVSTRTCRWRSSSRRALR